jgi:membrane associated rhomboid family serine protease
VLIAINVVAYVWLVSTGGLSTDLALLKHGALLGDACTYYGQWWRVVTGGFLHGSIAHIGLNMLALLQLGTLIEDEYGQKRFLLIYFISLVGSGLAVVFAAPHDLTVGASGAIFGLFGAHVAVGFRIGGQRGRALIMQVVPVIVINLAFTFAIPNISKAGHVGGLVIGLLAGLVLFMMPRPQRELAYVYAGGVPGETPAEVETIEQPPDAGPHEEAGAPPLEVRDPRE